MIDLKYVMVIRFLFILTVILISLNGYSQNDSIESDQDTLLTTNITNAESFVRGIYRSVDEFRMNAPSDTGNYVLEARSHMQQKYFVMSKNVLKKVDENGNKKKVKEEIWGFCDGYKAYIREDAFYPIEKIGRFCIYDITSIATLNRYYHSNWDYTEESRYSYMEKFVLDIVTGETFALSQRNLVSKILENDKDLYDEFRKIYFRKELLITYVDKYNRKHPLE